MGKRAEDKELAIPLQTCEASENQNRVSQNLKRIFKRLVSPGKGRLYPKDGVRAWIVCMAAVVSNIFIFGCSQTYGVMFPVLLEEFGESKAKTAWVGSLAMAMTLSFSPLAAILIEIIGARLVAVSGGVTAAVGLFVTSQVNSISLMYITYSLLFGLGSSFAYTPGFEIVPQYFDKRMALANGLMQGGAGVAIFAMSPINEILFTTLGWRKTFQVMGGYLCVVSLLTGVFYQSNQDPDGKSKQSDEDKVAIPTMADVEANTNASRRTEKKTRVAPLRKNLRLIVYSAVGFLLQFGNSIPLVHLGRHALDLGLPPDQVAKLYIGFGVGTTIGRVLTGRILDNRHVNSIYFMAASTFIIGLLNSLCPLTTGLPTLLTYFCINGLMDGCFVSTLLLQVIRCCSDSQRARGFGAFFFAVSLGFACGPPFGGFLADRFDTYVPVFYMSGGVCLASSPLIFLVKFQQEEKYQAEAREEVKLNDELLVVERETVI